MFEPSPFEPTLSDPTLRHVGTELRQPSSANTVPARQHPIHGLNPGIPQRRRHRSRNPGAADPGAADPGANDPGNVAGGNGTAQNGSTPSRGRIGGAHSTAPATRMTKRQDTIVAQPKPQAPGSPLKIPLFDIQGAPYSGNKSFVEATVRDACPDHTLCVHISLPIDKSADQTDDCVVVAIRQPSPIYAGDAITFVLNNPCGGDPRRTETPTRPRTTGHHHVVIDRSWLNAKQRTRHPQSASGDLPTQAAHRRPLLGRRHRARSTSRPSCGNHHSSIGNRSSTNGNHPVPGGNSRSVKESRCPECWKSCTTNGKHCPT
ncbi:MAG TPA: hypothetical protein VHW44_05220 [Pseudonocardiaceae bacterium]|nr:hypothetical protein [Pseudonocardiaceae bacterium]